MCVNGILNNYVCFIELLFTDQWHAIPVRGPGSLPLPPFRVKKEKNSEGRKAGRASKTKPPLPPSSRSETATEYAYTIFYGKQFKINDKAIIEIELVVTKCSVHKCLAYHHGNKNYVQPLEDMKNYSVFLAQIIFYLHDDLSMLFLPCGGWWKRCAELRSSTHIPALQHLSVLG